MGVDEDGCGGRGVGWLTMGRAWDHCLACMGFVWCVYKKQQEARVCVYLTP